MSAGIYVHIPFCTSKCNYCDFYSVTADQSVIDLFAESLLAHIELLKKTKWYDRVYNTIYFGGGTPPLLGAVRLGEIINSLRHTFSITPNAEITAEMNPENATIDFLKDIKTAGVNRLSVGIQTFDNDQLKLLGRIHDSNTAEKAIDDILFAGIENTNLDLLFGIPGQTVDNWQGMLQKAIANNPAHISGYGLTIESGTPLADLVKDNELTIPDNDTQAEMYNILNKILVENGYLRYEVSSFARPGYECRHNLKYWTDRKYLGLGPSAHSYYTHFRKSYHRDLDKYIDSVKKGKLPIALKEELSETKLRQERLMMGLRLTAGVELHSVKTAIDDNILSELIDQEYIYKQLGRIALTDKGFLLADEIIVKLLKD